MIKIKNLLFSSILLFSPILAIAESSLLGSKEPQIIVNNRILAKANGKAISVVDLMKKMDLLFYRQFPQYTNSSMARYQFYLANWQGVLSELIDRELIMADAAESKLTVSPGDVRQEMETMFGPNIIENLDKVGLTFEEAYQMVLSDITLKRMMYFRVQSKAINQTTPQKILDYYDKIAKDNIRDNEWIYRVITVRHKDPTKAAETANTVKNLLDEDKVSFADLPQKLKELIPESPKQPAVTVSEEYHTNEKELSDAFKTNLEALQPDSFSMPLPQKSRSDNSTVVRIFYLKEIKPGGVIPFKELEAKIKQILFEEAMEKESKTYLTKLRQHFDAQEGQIQELIDSDYQPFVLK
jgi:antitoxin component of RelBE/YafQ-DinJ toxin-antitoxin module